MSQEGLTTGGTVAAAVMYVLAFVCFIAGVWALWESRNQQTRTPGKIGMGIAGLVLCGLFATGPKWVNKAANTLLAVRQQSAPRPGLPVHWR
ncbi:hypothetical protein [Acetobacter ascendens]|uniref:Uncharacterized protein n=1 Tax=Acetobacter ascendens TaxID=481146 RepID=A0A1Y0V135_9PROT|nr:hypothetical protein [Acetobacter ascendens]ARW11880.1 hypothetical protein S101447_02843 [Acetobacter ascendens]